MPIQTLTKPKIVLENGKPIEVILRWKDFQDLLGTIENAYDVFQIKTAKKKGLHLRDFDIFLKKHAL